MEKRNPVTLGGILIAVGALLLLSNLAGAILGFRLWDLWPLIVVAVGCAFVLPPLFTRGKPGLGGLFIPGMPVLTTGVILLFASGFRWWDVWSWLWPWEVMGVALGFLFAAFYMKSVWLLIPAFVVGANGMLLQFCSVTGWWELWAVLWVIEPLSVALSFVVINARRPSPGLLKAGVTLGLLSALGFGLSFVAMILGSGWWIWKWAAPLATIAAGLYLLFHERPCGMRRMETER